MIVCVPGNQTAIFQGAPNSFKGAPFGFVASLDHSLISVEPKFVGVPSTSRAVDSLPSLVRGRLREGEIAHPTGAS